MHLRTLENVSIVFVLIRTTKMSVQLFLSQQLHIKLYLSLCTNLCLFLAYLNWRFSYAHLSGCAYLHHQLPFSHGR